MPTILNNDFMTPKVTEAVFTWFTYLYAALNNTISKSNQSLIWINPNPKMSIAVSTPLSLHVFASVGVCPSS